MYTTLSKKFVAALVVGTIFASAAPVHAVQLFNQTVDVYDAVDNDFITGSGIPINGFVQDSVLPTQSISVAVKPRDRDTGQPTNRSGNDYFVGRGQSTNNPARPNLAFDFQFDPGVDGLTNYQLRLSLDFNPAVGNNAAGDFTVVQLPIFGGGGPLDGWDDTDGYYLTNTSGQFSNKQNKAWNDGSVPYVIANTTNHTFLPPSVNFPSYNSNSLGEYEIRLEALDPTGTLVLASATAFAQVVPEPASMLLLGMSTLGSLLVRPRRNA
jgi:hypothetical protein